MISKIKSSSKKILERTRVLIILLAVILVPLLINQQFHISTVKGHSRSALPMELFSLWNDTAPTIDGAIDFSPNQLSAEWSAAAVYWMFDNTFSLKGKLLLQNDDNNLYIGMDMTNQQTESPPTIWGCAVYLDRDHDGRITSFDRAIYLIKNSSGEFVNYCEYDSSSGGWIELESGSPGSTLPISNIKADTAFTSSYFEEDDHRQFEAKIPLTVVNFGLGEITGIAFEAFENYNTGNDEITWPYIGSEPYKIRTTSKKWGDLYLGVDSGSSNPYANNVIEENTRIRSSALGHNNGTFLATGDIDGDDDLELIVSSNRTVSGDNNLLAIYDYVGGEFTRIWASWKTSHQSKMFLVRGIATYDFDEDGEDEIYVCGQGSQILRFSSWSEISQDFAESKIVFIHSPGLMGYISIGDVDDDGEAEIVCGDQQGEIITLAYESLSDTFTHESFSPYTPRKITGKAPYRIHAVEIADMDGDSKNELLFNSQYSADNDLSPTRLQIVEYIIDDYYDNLEDDLPPASITLTEDYFGHSIIVADVDNDLETETIIVGRDFLKVFGQDSFTEPAPPLQLSLNDGSSHPQMAGGAAVADLDDDGENELIFGHNNGTVFIVEVVDSGGDDLSYTVEWSGDLGSSPGKREGIIVFDVDNDSETEAIIGDNFGQILILGRSEPPELSITSPSSGSSSGLESIEVWWDVTEDFSMHHYDIYVNSELVGRAGGGQSGFIVQLSPGSNLLVVEGFDVTGKSDSDSVSVEYIVGAPDVTITNPVNNYKTTDTQVTIEYSSSDPGDIDHYEIYRNESQIVSYTTDTSYIVSLPSDGRWKITVVAVNHVANEGEDSIFVILDRGKPAVTILSPVNGSAVKETEIELYWSASDSLTEIAYSEVFKDGHFNGSTIENSYTVFLDLDKYYSFEVIAYDELGNYDSDSIIISRDRVLPQVTILSPEDNNYTTLSTITLSWNASDNVDGSGIDRSEVTVNSELKYFGSEQTALIDLEEDGVKEVVVTTYDKASNSVYDSVTVIFDNTAPIIEIMNPIDNYTTGLDYVPIYWESSDVGSGVEEYLVYIDEQEVETITDPEETFYSASIPENRTYTITIKAIDFLDHEAEDTILVNHDPYAPTVMIVKPRELSYYSPETQLNTSWEMVNLVAIGQIDIYLNGTLYNSSIEVINSYLIDFGSIPVDEFPLFNLTICVIPEGGGALYKDFRWITIDQSEPEVSIINPMDEEQILSRELLFEWYGWDLGSGICKYHIKINGEIIATWSHDKTSQIIDLEEGNGVYNLAVEVFDRAGNFANASVRLDVYWEPPYFEYNIPKTYVTRFDVFNFNLSVVKVGLGIKKLEVLADEEFIHCENYEDNIIQEPFWRLINVTKFENSTEYELHELKIIVSDIFDRPREEKISILIDKEEPEIIYSVLDTQTLSLTSLEVKLYEQQGKNSHNLTFFVSEKGEISSIDVTIVGQDISRTFGVFSFNYTVGSVYECALNIDFDGFSIGEYTLTISIADTAGNIVSETYSIVLVEIPWIQKGDNLLFVIFGGVLSLILAIIFFVSIRQPIANRRWKEAVLAVAYIKSTGLSCVFVPYSPEMQSDDQLFGGAMTGIRGVLEEITGERIQYEVQVTEFGEKTLMSCLGKFGQSVLISAGVKPILKGRLKRFTNDFENQYAYVLEDRVIIEPGDFEFAPILVETYFGISKILDLVELYTQTDLEGLEQPPLTYEEELKQPSEVLPLSEQKGIMGIELITDKDLLKSLTPEAKTSIVKSIQLTLTAILSLTDRDFDGAEVHNQLVVDYLETFIKTTIHIRKIRKILERLLNITQEIFAGISYGRRGEEAGLNLTIERASQIWFEITQGITIE